MNRRHALASLAAALALAACGGQGGAPRPGGPGVVGVARSSGLNRFARAVETAGMTEVLSGAGPFTVFAPTDRAFAAANLDALDRDALQRVIAYHVVPGQLTEDFLTGMDVNHTTLLGSSLNVDGSGPGLLVNGASVVRADLAASNGVVHSIDRVLTPR